MGIFRGTGGSGDANDNATVTTVTEKATEAATSATNAANSATAAAASATSAATSESTATTKASEASDSASNSATSATQAETAKTAAETAKTAAETAKTGAETAETNAETAQTAAETAQTAAETAQTAAETAETNASTSATTATTQATTATTKATEAATSATSAATSATTATTKATEASTSATNAAASATTASTKASEASTSATNAATSATNASTSETNAATSETNASTSATNAATSATNAATSATTATTKASEAATSATSASTSATTATTKASEASASAASALTYKNSAEAAKDAALEALDNFDDRYLGQKASDPTVDNDGDALVAGALYFNTTDDVMKVYEGSTWVAAYASLSGALLSANNLSDLDNASSARTNLGLVIGTDVLAPNGDGSSLTGINTDLVDDTTPQLGGDLDTNGNDINFGDNDKAQFGAGNDLQIYHDGSHSRIVDTGTGVIDIKTNGYQVQLSTSDDEMMLKAEKDSAVTLYHDNSPKLATTSTGVDVTGTVTADQIDIEGSGVLLKAGATNSVDRDVLTLGWVGGVGDYIDFNVPSADDESGTVRLGSNGDVYFYEDTGTTAKFFWDASEEQLNLTGNFTGKAPFNTFSGSYTAEYNSYGAEAGFQIMSYQSDNGSPYTKTSDLIANGDSTVPSEMRFLTKSNGSSSPAERMRIDSSGKVGIGTSSPSHKFHVYGSTNAARFSDDGTGFSLDIEHDTSNGITTLQQTNSGGDLRLQGGSSSGLLLFETGGSEAMRIDSNGNVGIGTSSPSSRLDLGSDVASNGYDINKITLWESGNNRYGFGVSGSQLNYITDANHVFYEDTTERMRIASGGNVGIGTSSPAGTLDVNGDIVLSGDTEHNIQKLTTSLVTNAAVETTHVAGRNVDIYAYDDVNIRAGGGDHVAVHAGGAERMRINSSGTMIHKGAAVFNEDGGDSDFRVESDGRTGMLHVDAGNNRLGIGTSSPDELCEVNGGVLKVSNVGAELLMEGASFASSQVAFGTSSTTRQGRIVYSHSNNYLSFMVNGQNSERFRMEGDGDFHADGDVIANSSTISDERLKENIKPVESALDKVSALGGYTFDYKKDGKQSAGVLAQEVMEVLPSAVTMKKLPLGSDDDQEYMTVQYDQLTALLIESIKELKAEIEELRNNNAN